MTYAISDIHGCYDKYIQMLAKIGFGESDMLYVLGDVVDRGDNPIKVLQDMRARPNVRPIMGNHDYIALTLVHQVLESKTIGGELLEDLQLWFSDGGVTTFEGFLDLSEDERKQVGHYLSTFSPYEAVTVNSRKYILTHAGLPEESTADNLDSLDMLDFITAKTDYNRRYFADAFLVTGHVPTFLIEEDHQKIYRRHNHIAIDTGAVFHGMLACVCLDTGEEFYV